MGPYQAGVRFIMPDAEVATDPDIFQALLTQVSAPKAQKQTIQYFLPYLIGGAVSAGG